MANFTSKLLSSGIGPCFSWMATWHMQQNIPISPTRHDSHFWKSICKLIPTVQAATYCHQNSHTRTSFGRDSWTNLGKLYLAMPVLFSFATDTECSVACQFDNDHWELSLIHPLSHTAQIQLQTVLLELDNHQPGTQTTGGSRHMVTTGKPTTTNDFYRLFSDRGMLWDNFKWVWQPVIPLKPKFFLWLAFRSRLNTKDNMVKKCWCPDAGCDQCPALESIHHIALHCKQASWVWDKLGLAHTAASANTLSQFVSTTEKTIAGKAWPICVAACIHSLWTARNNRVFNQKSTNRPALLQLIADELRLWSHRSPKMKTKIIYWAQRVTP